MGTRIASVLLLLFFLSSYSLVHSQSISSDLRIQIPQAMNLERAGKWAEALDVYLSLERMQPWVGLIIPKGVWHRVDVLEPKQAQYVCPGY